MAVRKNTIGRFARGFAEGAIGCIALGLVVAHIAGAENLAERPVATDAAANDQNTEAEKTSTPAANPQPAPVASPPLSTAPPLASDEPPAPPAPAAHATAVQPPTATPPPPAGSLAVEAAKPLAAVAADQDSDDESRAPTPDLKPARVLFGAAKDPAPLAARAIGSYARGCLSGAKALPVDGTAWQAMRLSRNRNWGHPRLIALVQKLAEDGRAKDNWPGLLVGDLSQPRGGPMLTGHASHQVGLDADVWLTPMPDRRLSERERETMEAISVLAEDQVSVAREKWSDAHTAIIRRAASYPEVERVLVHPAIKQVLCYAAGDDRAWLHKVRPYWGHHYHFHVRIGCPANSSGCVPQVPPPGDEGCGKELDDWLKRVANVPPAEPAPLPVPPQKPVKEKPQMTLVQLPAECRVVLATGNPDVKADVAAAALAAKLATEKPKEKVAHKAAEGSAGEAQKEVQKADTAKPADAKSPTVKPEPKAPDKASALPQGKTSEIKAGETKRTASVPRAPSAKPTAATAHAVPDTPH